MYELVAAFADAAGGELRCLEHPLPWRAEEEIWFEEPPAEDGPAAVTAHILVPGAVAAQEVVVPVRVM